MEERFGGIDQSLTWPVRGAYNVITFTMKGDLCEDPFSPYR
jgi:hypothetical protein